MQVTFFLTSTEKLPTIPSWASDIRFVNEQFQEGLLLFSKAAGLRALAWQLALSFCQVDEYRFET